MNLGSRYIIAEPKSFSLFSDANDYEKDGLQIGCVDSVHIVLATTNAPTTNWRELIVLSGLKNDGRFVLRIKENNKIQLIYLETGQANRTVLSVPVIEAEREQNELNLFFSINNFNLLSIYSDQRCICRKYLSFLPSSPLEQLKVTFQSNTVKRHTSYISLFVFDGLALSVKDIKENAEILATQLNSSEKPLEISVGSQSIFKKTVVAPDVTKSALPFLFNKLSVLNSFDVFLYALVNSGVESVINHLQNVEDKEHIFTDLSDLVVLICLISNQVSVDIKLLANILSDREYLRKIAISIRSLKLTFAEDSSLSRLLVAKKKDIFALDKYLSETFQLTKVSYGIPKSNLASKPISVVILTGYLICDRNNTHVQMLLRFAKGLTESFPDARISLAVTGEHYFSSTFFSRWGKRGDDAILRQTWQEVIGNTECYLNYSPNKPLAEFSEWVSEQRPDLVIIHGSPVEPFYTCPPQDCVPTIYLPSSVKERPRSFVTKICVHNDEMYSNISATYPDSKFIRLINPFYLLTTQKPFEAKEHFRQRKYDCVLASVIGRGFIFSFLSKLTESEVEFIVSLLRRNNAQWIFVGEANLEILKKRSEIASAIEEGLFTFIASVENDEFDDFTNCFDVIVGLPDVTSGGGAIYRSIYNQKLAIACRTNDVASVCPVEFLHGNFSEFLDIISNALTSENTRLEVSLRTFNELVYKRTSLCMSWKTEILEMID